MLLHTELATNSQTLLLRSKTWTYTSYRPTYSWYEVNKELTHFQNPKATLQNVSPLQPPEPLLTKWTHHCLLEYENLENILQMKGTVKFLLDKSELDFEFWDEKYAKQLEFQGAYTCSQKNNAKHSPEASHQLYLEWSVFFCECLP